MQATWNNTTIATSDNTVSVENNAYFPPESLDMQYFKPSDHKTDCPWKGTASYYHVEVNGKVNENAAWYYAEPKEAAANINGYIAFWKGVEVK